jgi:lipopolysaccharide transport system ATP-binding protein
MSDVIISVENLGKKYAIRHQDQRSNYKSLREVVARKTASLFNRRDRQAARARTREDFWALRDVSFELERGKVLGIIGRNGAGKSTLLKVLSRITEPSEGRVTLRGRVASLLEVGTGFHPELTGRENILLNGSILGMSRVEIRRKFDEIVDFAGVEKFLDTPVKRYSSGMYVRLAFAVAAHLEPEILIVDEVLAVGDKEFQKKCLGKMQDVATTEGRTVLFVSHNMAAVNQLCTRGILLSKGTKIADGPSEEVTSMYLMDAVASIDGRADLRGHPARPQSCLPLITQLTVRTRGEIITSTIPSGEEFAVDICVTLPMPLEEPRLAIAIEDSYGRRLMTFASYFNTRRPALPPLSSHCIIRCDAGKLPLAPGRYLISASVSTRDDGLLDSIDGAMWIEVVWNNNYTDGEPYSPVYGPILKESKWFVIEPL